MDGAILPKVAWAAAYAATSAIANPAFLSVAATPFEIPRAMSGASASARINKAAATADPRFARSPSASPTAAVIATESTAPRTQCAPAMRVDEAAFAAKMLADRLLARLDALGLCCARVAVEAETEHGEHLTGREVHADAVDGEGVAVPHRDVAELQHGPILHQNAPTLGTRSRSTSSTTAAVVVASTTEAARAMP